MRELVKDVISFLRDWTELIGWIVLILIITVLIKVLEWVNKL